jgi:ADP-heptose:LPS heptosyltransferase
MPAIGYAKEGRSPLLKQTLRLDYTIHMRMHYQHLFQAMCIRLGHSDTPQQPDDATLRLTPAARTQAQQALRNAGIAAPFVAVSPICSGGLESAARSWPHFPSLVQQLAAKKIPVVTCPGPEEEAALRAWSTYVTCLPGLSVSAYAAVLASARCVVSIDTGAGHMAASLGVPVISVLGATLANRWGIQGPHAHTVCQWPQWPSHEDIFELVINNDADGADCRSLNRDCSLLIRPQ